MHKNQKCPRRDIVNNNTSTFCTQLFTNSLEASKSFTDSNYRYSIHPRHEKRGVRLVEAISIPLFSSSSSPRCSLFAKRGGKSGRAALDEYDVHKFQFGC